MRCRDAESARVELSRRAAASSGRVAHEEAPLRIFHTRRAARHAAFPRSIIYGLGWYTLQALKTV